MKISELDRAEALIRMPEYLEDLDKLTYKISRAKSLGGQLKNHRFEKKYRLLRVVTPELVEAVKRLSGQRRELELKRLFAKPTRYQDFEIDLNKSKKENILLLSHLYDAWQDAIRQIEKMRKVKPERKRETFYDAWLVYDMLHKENMTYAQAARQLSGEKGYPSGNDKLMAAYRVVERADKKAKKIIKHIRQEIKGFTIAIDKPIRDIVRETIKELKS